TNDVEEIISTVKNIAPTFGGINLEDISAPRCFEIERRLQEELDIPVFHDDQHGTAIVVSAGILNALRVVKKDIETIEIVINGAGSAGIAICKMLMNIGAKNIILVDRFGAIYKGMDGLNSEQTIMAESTNKSCKRGVLADVMVDADVFIGVSAPNIVSSEMVKSMAHDAIVFAMANPTPEIMPEEAKRGGARVVGTGRSDYPNQINNVIAFPGIFRGALDARATCISEEMKMAACHAIANLITDEELSADYIIPKAFDKNVGTAVAKAVFDATIQK
ncbi:MAG: malic enzyme-like NAD(P)-binding protein, partial [Oscillospiraceae bacterium]